MCSPFSPSLGQRTVTLKEARRGSETTARPPAQRTHHCGPRPRPHLSKTAPCSVRARFNIRGRTSGRRSRPGASPRAGGAGKRPPCRGSAAARAAASRARPRRSRPMPKEANRGHRLRRAGRRAGGRGGESMPLEEVDLCQRKQSAGHRLRRAGRRAGGRGGKACPRRPQASRPLLGPPGWPALARHAFRRR